MVFCHQISSCIEDVMQVQTQNHASIVSILRERANYQPNQIAFIFLQDGESKSISLTYRALDQQARIIAQQLYRRQLTGERVVLVLPFALGLEFIIAFLGCLYAGVVAVPSYPPQHAQAFDDFKARLHSAQPQAILTHSSLQTKLQRQLQRTGEAETFAEIEWLISDHLGTPLDTELELPTLHCDQLACIQYTSGATGMPKGVMITHDCILHNQKLLQVAFGHSEISIGVGWLPLFHDMGLFGNVLQALYVGIPCVLMSPITFIQKPSRWLQAISRYRATTSGAPNFAYDLLCRQVSERQKEHLDLSCWDVAFTGAEPIRAQTMERFANAFASCGFRQEAFYPCYGMAEATLMITGSQKGKFPTIQYVESESLKRNQVILATHPKTGFEPVVSCGQSWLNDTLVMVDPQSRQPLPARQIGEIWYSSAGVGKGYWQLQQASKQTFGAYLAETHGKPFLKTGDLGFMENNELFITGRLTELMVFNGFNHYPYPIEQTVAQSHRTLRPNGGVAFAVPIQGRERLVIVQEIERGYRAALSVDEVIETIRWQVFQKHFLDVYAVVLLNTGKIPKTSSGKLQRSLCKAAFLEKDFEAIAQWQADAESPSDPLALLKRYANPLTHLRRHLLIIQGHFHRFWYATKQTWN